MSNRLGEADVPRPGATDRDAAGAPDTVGSGFRTLTAARAAALLVLLTSLAGLLCLRIDVYDDSAMLLGARLLRADLKPYRDFYTHYGPLIYDVLALFGRLPANPGVVLRVCQGAFLVLTCAFLWWLVRRVEKSLFASMTWVPFAVLALSSIFQLPAFLAFAWSSIALVLIAVLPTLTPGRPIAAVVAAGAALALAALARPAFAAYAGGTIALLFSFGLVSESDRRVRRTLGLAFMAAAFLGLGGLWLILCRSISPATFWNSAIAAPQRLMGGGSRFLPPDFFPALLPVLGSAVVTLIGSGIVFASTLAWLAMASSARVLRLAGGATVLASLSCLTLLGGETTGRMALPVALVWFLLAFTIALIGRKEIRSSRSLCMAAPFGLAAAAFSHYFWARPDRPHLMPLLALAVTAAALGSVTAGRRRQVALGALLAGAYLSLWRIPWSPFPAMAFFNGGVTRILQHSRQPGVRWQTLWPAGEISSDALNIVSLADRNADPGSRFVAVGSSQAETSGNPILLFLLSSRLPYSKWWAYDPGVQNSPAIQREMEQELRASGSRTAVVWPAQEYFYEPPHGMDSLRLTGFDEQFRLSYSEHATWVGHYELRVRP
jgi:hypothetical protein